MLRVLRAGGTLVICLLFVLFGPPYHAMALDEAPAGSYETYSTGVKIIEYGATGTSASYCSNLRVEDEGVKNVFCIEPGVDFSGGAKKRVDALTVIPQDRLTEAALGVYYLSTIEPPAGLTRLGWQQYWIWVDLRSITVPNVTDIWVRNGPSEQVQNETLRAIRTFVAENKDRFTGHGYIYTDGSSQRVARFWVEGNGIVRLRKSPTGDAELAALCPELYSPAGAVYTVYDSPTLAGDARVGSLVTDGEGKTGILTLPPGTYYVAETKAPYGFSRDTTLMRKDLAAGETWEIEALDEPLFGKVEILLEKLAAGAGDTGDGGSADPPSLSGAEFTVRYYPTLAEDIGGMDPLRTWKFKTDGEGKIRLSEEYLIGGDELFTARDGSPVLLLGTYIFEETSAPEGYLQCEEIFTARVTADHGSIPEQVLYQPPTVYEYMFPHIKTKAFWSGGAKNHMAGESADVLDRVSMSGLIPGKEYLLKASLVDTEEGSVIAEGELSFTASGAEEGGSVDPGTTVDMEREVPIHVESLPEGCRRLVVFEELYMRSGSSGESGGGTGDWIPAAEEKTEDSPDQSLFLPDMATAASVSRAGDSDVPTVLTDVIEYSGLHPGTEIRVETTLVDRATGEPAKDKEGEPVTVSTLFTPEAPEGSLEVEVSIPTEIILGRKLVFFEDAYEGEELVIRHNDIENEKQTVTIQPEPEEPVVERPPGPEAPKTGDEAMPKTWLMTFGGAALLLMAAALAERSGFAGRMRSAERSKHDDV